MQAEASDDEDDAPAASTSSTSGAPDGSTAVSLADKDKAAKAGGDGKKAAALTPEQERRKKQKEEQEAKLAAEKAKVREERVKVLADKLRDKLALFSEQAQNEDDQQIADGGALPFRQSCRSGRFRLPPEQYSVRWNIPRLPEADHVFPAHSPDNVVDRGRGAQEGVVRCRAAACRRARVHDEGTLISFSACGKCA